MNYFVPCKLIELVADKLRALTNTLVRYDDFLAHKDLQMLAMLSVLLLGLDDAFTKQRELASFDVTSTMFVIY